MESKLPYRQDERPANKYSVEWWLNRPEIKMKQSIIDKCRTHMNSLYSKKPFGFNHMKEYEIYDKIMKSIMSIPETCFVDILNNYNPKEPHIMFRVILNYGGYTS